VSPCREYFQSPGCPAAFGYELVFVSGENGKLAWGGKCEPSKRSAKLEMCFDAENVMGDRKIRI
jgi:hypothetical protein